MAAAEGSEEAGKIPESVSKDGAKEAGYVAVSSGSNDGGDGETPGGEGEAQIIMKARTLVPSEDMCNDVFAFICADMNKGGGTGASAQTTNLPVSGGDNVTPLPRPDCDRSCESSRIRSFA